MEGFPQTQPQEQEEKITGKIGNYLSGPYFEEADIVDMESFLQKLDMFDTIGPDKKMSVLLDLQERIYYISSCLQAEQEMNQLSTSVEFPSSQQENKLLSQCKILVKEVENKISLVKANNECFLFDLQIQGLEAEISELKSFYEKSYQYHDREDTPVRFMDIAFKRGEFLAGKITYRIKGGGVDVRDEDNNWVPLEEFQGLQGRGKEKLNAKKFIYLTSIEKYLSQKYNIPFFKTSIPTKFLLYEYLLNSNQEEFEHVMQTAQHTEDKESFLNSFLSLEHGGKDMGNIILSLAENLQKYDGEKVFAGYSKLIDTAEQLEQQLDHMFKSEEQEYLKKLPFQLRDALMLRAKDILVGAHKVVEGREKLNIEDVLSAIEGVTLMVGILADLGTKKEFQFEIKEQQDALFKYEVKDKNGYEYKLKIFIRPEAEKNAQARVNFELSFDTTNPNVVLQKAFHNEIISHTQNKTTAQAVLRIGIDREDYGGNEALSLDIGRSEHSDDALTRSGDVLGNLLVLASTEGHHTTSPFSKELAGKENFKLLSNRLSEYLQSQGRAEPSDVHRQS